MGFPAGWYANSILWVRRAWALPLELWFVEVTLTPLAVLQRQHGVLDLHTALLYTAGGVSFYLFIYLLFPSAASCSSSCSG